MFFYFTFVIEGKTVCAGCTGGGCSDTEGGGIIAGGSFVAGTNTFFGSGFFGVTGTHSFSENTSYEYIKKKHT